MEYLAVKISTVELPVSFEVREKYLLVIGRGKRETFKEMVMASEMVYAKTIETKTRFLLVDYRDLEVNLNMSEAVNMVKRSEAVQPEFKNLTGAIVVGRQPWSSGISGSILQLNVALKFRCLKSSKKQKNGYWNKFKMLNDGHLSDGETSP